MMSRRTKKQGLRNTSQQGFTLVELLVVIAIIGLLASMILGVAGLAAKKADASKAGAEIQKWKNGIEEYRIIRGAPPAGEPMVDSITQVTNDDFVNKMSNGLYAAAREIWDELVWTDPWGNAYQYQKKASFGYEVWSKGPNAVDESDDIIGGKGGF